MIQLIDFQARHIDEIELQAQQGYLSGMMSQAEAQALEGGMAFTGVENGIIMGIAGVLPMWQGRGLAWSYLSRHVSGPKFLEAHRLVKRFLDGCYLHRIEMTVDCDFPQGHRWAKMLGFTMEAERMRGYRPDGGDCALYARLL